MAAPSGARAASDATGEGRWRYARLGLVAMVLVCGGLTSRAAYLELRSAKCNYAGTVAATASFVPPGQVVLTNLWWFDQVTASLHGTRVFAYAADRAAGHTGTRDAHPTGA